MADIYHIWADHHKDVDAYDFAKKMRKFLDGLVEMDKMKSYRLTKIIKSLPASIPFV